METTQLTKKDAILVIMSLWVKVSEGAERHTATHALMKHLGIDFGLFDSITDNSFQGIYAFINEVLRRDPISEVGDEQFFEAAELILQRSRPYHAVANGSADPFHGKARNGNWFAEAI